MGSNLKCRFLLFLKKYIECYRLLWDTVCSHASSTRPDYRFVGVESLYILLNIEIMKVELG